MHSCRDGLDLQENELELISESAFEKTGALKVEWFIVSILSHLFAFF